MTNQPFSIRRRGTWGLGVALFFLYLLSTSREQPWADATPIWQAADAIAHRGEINIHKRWPPTLALGKDGKVYAAAPLVQSLVQVPAAAAVRAIGKRWPAANMHAFCFLPHVAPAALGALTCVLYFGICRRLRVGRAAALAATGSLALGTFLWLYARYPYSEVLQAFAFTGLVGALLAARADPGRRTGLALGAWAGLLVASKLVYLAAVPGAFVFLVWSLRGRWRALGGLFAWAAAATVPFVVLVLAYNHARWGSPFSTGYEAKAGQSLAENTFLGLWGLLLSPGKSVFLYGPPLVLSVVAAARTWRRARDLAVVLLVTVVPLVLVHARLLFWSGDYAWGPRYLVFAVPAAALPAAFLWDDALAAATRVRRWLAVSAVGAVALAGVGVQVLGNAFHWDHFIRIQREARIAWLGLPNTAGTPFPDFDGVCGACFEDMHGLQWLPPFQPIAGHWWLLRHVPFKHDWLVAEKDAPWHRYTTLRLNISTTYPRARIDWWFLDYAAHPTAGVVLLTTLSFGFLVGAWLLAAELRVSRGRTSARSPAGPPAPDPRV